MLIATSGCCGARSAPPAASPAKNLEVASSATILPDPAAETARQATIARDRDSLAAECQQAAGGDWDAWQAQTAPHRAALRTCLGALKVTNHDDPHAHGVVFEPLAGRDGFPLFEICAPQRIAFLCDDRAMDAFRKTRAVVATSRWLKARGVDLILVPAPPMTDVYVEHFLDPCPPDGIIAPHVRRAMLELLDDDVELVDVFGLLRARREPDPEYLYNTADRHWAPKAMRVVVDHLANRIARYEFAARAQAATPMTKTSPGGYGILSRPGVPVDTQPGQLPRQIGWDSLTPEQRALAARAQTRVQERVTLTDGGDVPDDPQSAVVVVGNSFACGGFKELLVNRLNLLIHGRDRPADTTEWLRDFVRQPELLAGRRVVVWVTTEWHMAARFQSVPGPITAAPGQ
jgi:hypothetical protein